MAKAKSKVKAVKKDAAVSPTVEAPSIEPDASASSTTLDSTNISTPPPEDDDAGEDDQVQADVAVDVDEPEAGEEEDKVEEATVVEVKTYQGQDNWSAIWSAEANQYYFHNSVTNITTWENPRDTTSSAAIPSTSAAPINENSITNDVGAYGGIDPDLAYLDPSLRQSSSSSAPSYQARFNSRTGRFQGDPSMTPDRISEFKRGERQQEAFYDTASWQESLGGKGLKRSGTSESDKPKKLTAKELEQFKMNKLAKKKRKLTAWLAD